MQGAGIFWAIWRWVKWPLIILVLAFIALVAWRLKLLYDKDDTDAAVAAIHANRLTQEDVFGPLPVEPDPAENNKTLAGIDVNSNGIRDDVERSIYFKYQSSAAEAAPAYQYAKALQMEFTSVYNSETLVAVVQEEGRGFGCIFDLFDKETLTSANQKVDMYVTEIEDLVFNTDSRRDFREQIRDKYMVSYGLLSNEQCDIDTSSL